MANRKKNQTTDNQESAIINTVIFTNIAQVCSLKQISNTCNKICNHSKLFSFTIKLLDR